jgi:hypothetical protein
VREQYERFRPDVVLIEDKASGTQLIQELIAEGLHAATRYQPQSDKVMRMHAQTAMIENGFVHLPKEAGWLAEYLHEMTAFPRGRHDDQVDSTAQMLDWFKQGSSGPSSNAGIWHLYKQRYEARQAAASQPARPEPLSVIARRLGILRRYDGGNRQHRRGNQRYERRDDESAFHRFSDNRSTRVVTEMCPLLTSGEPPLNTAVDPLETIEPE